MCIRDRIRHLATKTFWAQQLVAEKVIAIEPVAGDDNLADLGAAALPRTRLERLRKSCGLRGAP
eukprot:4287135-Pyramimonas_sp.AAC.1